MNVKVELVSTYERLCTKTRFKTERKGKSEMAYSMAKAAGSGRSPPFSLTTLPSNTMNPCPSKFLFLLHSNVDDNSRSIFYSLCGTFKSKVLEAVSDYYSTITL